MAPPAAGLPGISSIPRPDPFTGMPGALSGFDTKEAHHRDGPFFTRGGIYANRFVCMSIQSRYQAVKEFWFFSPLMLKRAGFFIDSSSSFQTGVHQGFSNFLHRQRLGQRYRQPKRKRRQRQQNRGFAKAGRYPRKAVEGRYRNTGIHIRQQQGAAGVAADPASAGADCAIAAGFAKFVVLILVFVSEKRPDRCHGKSCSGQKQAR